MEANPNVIPWYGTGVRTLLLSRRHSVQRGHLIFLGRGSSFLSWSSAASRTSTDLPRGSTSTRPVPKTERPLDLSVSSYQYRTMEARRHAVDMRPRRFPIGPAPAGRSPSRPKMDHFRIGCGYVCGYANALELERNNQVKFRVKSFEMESRVDCYRHRSL